VPTATVNGSGFALTATYHDTPDRRLARAGIELRHRLENGVGLWEAEVGGRRFSAPGGPADLPKEFARRLLAPLRNAEIVVVARLRIGEDDVALLEGQHVLRTYADVSSALRASGETDEHQEGSPGKRAPALEHVRAYLRAQLGEIERHDPVVRAKNDADSLHDFRVAVRRARTALRVARGLFEPQWVDDLRSELHWLADELGAVRDLDVLLVHVREFGTDVRPIVRALEAERRREYARLLASLGGQRYLGLLEDLTTTVEAPPVRTTSVSLERIAAREFRKLREVVLTLGRLPTDEALHRARIRAKRARYAAELAVPVVGKRAKKVVRAAKKFQDVVGEHQDAVVAEQRIRAVASRSESTATAFAAGRLVEHQEQRRRAARGNLSRSWKRLDRRGRRAWS
jgi:CHAD domain-containing protein